MSIALWQHFLVLLASETRQLLFRRLVASRVDVTRGVLPVLALAVGLVRQARPLRATRSRLDISLISRAGSREELKKRAKVRQIKVSGRLGF